MRDGGGQESVGSRARVIAGHGKKLEARSRKRKRYSRIKSSYIDQRSKEYEASASCGWDMMCGRQPNLTVFVSICPS
jgi:hypothetical protein